MSVELNTMGSIVQRIREDAERFHDSFLSDPHEFCGYDKISEELNTLANSIETVWKREMDEAAEHVNVLLQEIPTNPRPHNWLIRNGYKDESYQECFFGQEIYDEK